MLGAKMTAARAIRDTAEGDAVIGSQPHRARAVCTTCGGFPGAERNRLSRDKFDDLIRWAVRGANDRCRIGG